MICCLPSLYKYIPTATVLVHITVSYYEYLVLTKCYVWLRGHICMWGWAHLDQEFMAEMDTGHCSRPLLDTPATALSFSPIIQICHIWAQKQKGKRKKKMLTRSLKRLTQMVKLCFKHVISCHNCNVPQLYGITRTICGHSKISIPLSLIITNASRWRAENVLLLLPLYHCQKIWRLTLTPCVIPEIHSLDSWAKKGGGGEWPYRTAYPNLPNGYMSHLVPQSYRNLPSQYVSPDVRIPINACLH